jgi:metal-responsive CopG/Arc/MetJ family transcriptional regulator
MIISNTREENMRTAKIAISINKDLLMELDGFVNKKQFSSRSQAIQQAVEDKIARMKKTRLSLECEHLDKNIERALSEEGMALEDKQWSEY